jgi:DNA-binding FadR family transcriptional regulator
VQILNNLREQMYRYRLEYIKDTGKRQVLLIEHDNILNAIKSRNLEQAKNAMREHIDNQEITVSRNLKES